MSTPEQLPSLEQSPEPLDIHAVSVANENHPDRNEDAVFIRKEQQCFGVLDGMGGHAAGNVASAEAGKVIIAEVEKLSDTLSLEETQEEIRRILHEANDRLLDMAGADISLEGMGTTASIVKIWKGESGERKAVVANVGDSRVYAQKQDGTLKQITLDDSIVRLSIAGNTEARRVQGVLNNVTNITDLNEQERSLFKSRSMIINHLGDMSMTVRMHVVDIETGDTVLAVSDGISDNLTDTEISKILKETQTSAEATERLINEARARSRSGHFRAKHDDMSAIAAKVL